MSLTLVIGNKTYSSWSFRPWIAMSVAGIPFEEIVVPLPDEKHGGGMDPELLKHSPSGRVPVLKDGDLTIWESMAILEYLAESFPDRELWPADKAARAIARAVSNEMHAGFTALRSTCHMNMRRTPSALDVSEAVRRDVVRIVEIWQEMLERSGGPFLFGEFSIADAMYAPVVNRFHVYQLTGDTTARAYMDRMMALNAWRQWEDAARAEPWVIESEEI